jgi:hypothetical protein
LPPLLWWLLLWLLAKLKLVQLRAVLVRAPVQQLVRAPPVPLVAHWLVLA